MSESEPTKASIEPMNNNKVILQGVLQDEEQTLHNIIRSYVVKMGLARGDGATNATQEIMNEMVVDALRNAEQYDPDRRPIPWLLGIAINRIRRCLSDRTRNNKREIAVRDLYPRAEGALSDDELFDYLERTVTSPNRLETQEELNAYLEPLSETDREIIRMSILQEMDSVTIAKMLSSTPSAIRVRLHRALKRLRGHIEIKEVLTHDN